MIRTSISPAAPKAFDGIYHEWPLALARIVIGWHFLYEGWTKVISPGWTSGPYLRYASGPFAGIFHWMASNDGLVRVIDTLNIWGLVLVGLGLVMGVLSRAAAGGGIALLALYYFAYPPLFGPVTNGVAEGQYLIVNKNLVELFALIVVFAYPAPMFGLGVLLSRLKTRAAAEAASPKDEAARNLRPTLLESPTRRQLIYGMAGVPVLGGFVLAVLKKHGWKSFEEVHLAAKRNPGDTAVASATMKTFQFSTIRDLKGPLPYAKIGNLTLSRMILGGNLMGGWAHARDLIYVSKLVRAYHNKNKIFQTFDIAESCGVNTILTNPVLCSVINDYWRNGGKIQFISDCGGGDMIKMIQRSIDAGASACYLHGGIADGLVEGSKYDLIATGLELIRKNGLPAGIGGHKLATIRGCVEKGLRPDFWMKTFHRVDYWSARQPESWQGMDWSKPDNIWCESPEGVAAYMKDLAQPWIAFKTLAAGAIEPKVGFRYAFENGADFICVGMYDFQIVDDVNIALEVLNGPLNRQREWHA